MNLYLVVVVAIFVIYATSQTQTQSAKQFAQSCPNFTKPLADQGPHRANHASQGLGHLQYHSSVYQAFIAIPALLRLLRTRALLASVLAWLALSHSACLQSIRVQMRVDVYLQARQRKAIAVL